MAARDHPRQHARAASLRRAAKATVTTPVAAFEMPHAAAAATIGEQTERAPKRARRTRAAGGGGAGGGGSSARETRTTRRRTARARHTGRADKEPDDA